MSNRLFAGAWITCLYLLAAAGPAADAPAFPLRDLLPKDETGASRFLEQHPEYDGRGVVVAVLDTGVDPAAPGLQVTSTGSPKIIDVIDATGSGDVPLSGPRKPEEGRLEGLTGRSLAIPEGWQNPSGDYRLGIKPAWELFPSELLQRLLPERRRVWDEHQREREAELQAALAAWDKEHPHPEGDQKAEREELQARLDVLKAAQDSYDDPGPVYDCVVFHDGKRWQTAIDTDEDGDLADETLLAEYEVAQQYASFGEMSQLNFAVHVEDEGKLLSVVVVSGDHGTHVAGILAGNDPDQPELNGIAPGAQIVSIKIGDTRLDSMETGAALARAMQAVIEHSCDLINYSYGEASAATEHGPLMELMAETVREHGVIFVSSAGNSGPALSTVGSPGGCDSAIIGVGAYVSPAMMASEYALRDEIKGLPFSWTSRGPALDGSLGVDIFAPGAAYAPVPSYTLQAAMRMNGTSMASPNACGGIALLLSGMKQSKLACSPISVHRAIQNTAESVPGAEPFAQGPGLLQVDRAFEHLSKFADAPAEQLEFDLNIDGNRGIYLRESEDVQAVRTFEVEVTPLYKDDEPHETELALKLPLVLSASADWIEVGEYLVMTSGEESFEVDIDPTALPAGVHFAEVTAVDPNSPERGPLFRVPVTVIKTLGAGADAECGDRICRRLTMSAGVISRDFIAVPDGATWIDLSLRLVSDEAKPDDEKSNAAGDYVYLLHAIQLLPGENFEAGELSNRLRMEPGSHTVQSFKVEEGRTLELCLAQYWSSLGDSEIEYEVAFRGLQPGESMLTLPSDGQPDSVTVSSHLHRERCNPQGTLETWRQLLTPKSSRIEPLNAERDRLPGSRRMHQLLLTYAFSQAEAGPVTIRVPELEELLYDGPVVSQRWLLFDARKRLVAADDMFPDATTLEPGEYELRLQLLHPDADAFKSREQTLLAIDRELPSSIPVQAFSTRVAVADGRPDFRPMWLDPGETATVWFGAPRLRGLPAEAGAGDILMGTITWEQSTSGLSGADSRPEGFPVQFVLPPGRSKKGGRDDGQNSGARRDRDQTTDDRLAEELLDFRLEQLAGLDWSKDQEQIQRISDELLKAHPDARRRILVARLHLVDNDDREERLSGVVEAADKVIAAINRRRLARHFGMRPDPEQQELNAEREAERTDLIDALYRKGRALGFMELPEVLKEHPIEDRAAHDKAFDATFEQLSRWADTTDAEHFKLQVRRDRRRGHYAKAMQLLNQHSDLAREDQELAEKRRDVYDELGWDDWRDYEQRWILIRFPAEYEGF